jgi:hypothetical protein
MFIINSPNILLKLRFVKYLSYSLLFISLLFSSCGKNKDFYYIDPELQPYLDAFLEEGKKRGHEFDFDKSGLILKFSHLSGSQIGLCHHQIPLLIEIDSLYWQNVTGKKNEKELKTNLIFHELGHGVLNRSHDNTVLPSGDWKTIMCGGEKMDSRNWNVNFYGFREKYYIDELFDPKTSVPEWAVLQPDFSSIKYKTGFFDDFFNNNNKWVTGNVPLYKSSVYRGEYKFQTKTGKSIMSISNLGINTADDFWFEAKIRMSKSEIPDAKFGVIFGTRNNSNTNYFLIDNKKTFYIGNSQYFGWFTECTSEYIKPMMYNTISIRKVDDMLYFYINGKYVYMNEIKDPQGSFFGFQLSGNSIISIDYVKISLPTDESKEIIDTPEHIILEDSIVSGKKDRRSLPVEPDSISIFNNNPDSISGRRNDQSE